MIPYIKVPDLHPFQITWLPLHPFGLLVATGVLLGTVLANRRARKRGFDLEQLNSFITWMLVGGFVSGHVLDEILYDPHRITESVTVCLPTMPDKCVSGPFTLLMLWAGLGSFPGFIGAATGVVLWKYFDYRAKEPGGRAWFVRSRPARPILPFCDLILSVFPVAWVFGRSGCASVHDHPGAVASGFAPLAVEFPSAIPSATDGPGVHDPFGPITFIHGQYPRYDLGLLELMFTIVLASLLALTWRKRLATGTYVAVTCLAYSPVRFMMDFLRIKDVAGADPRYAGLTPAQWACVGMFVFGLSMAFYVRSLKVRGIDPADALRARPPRALPSPAPTG
jgi:phosphatidylglycerol---prolipoprotein diacylglyceryl transferase